MDTWSYPAAGRPYIDLHWLFQFLVYLVFRLGGEPALVWFACLVVTLTWFVVYRLTRRHAPAPLAAALVALGIILASERLSPRPEILSFLFLAAMQWLVTRHEEGWKRAWLLLPVLMLFWVNTEGLFVLGYVALGAALLNRFKDRRLWQALGLSILAALANPFFVQGALHPFVLFSRINRSLPIYSATIGEFLSPFAGEALHPSVALYPAYLALIGLVTAGRLAASFSRRRPRAGDVVLLAVFVYLSATARRNLALLPLVATPVLGRWLTDLGRLPRVRSGWARLSLDTRRIVHAAALLGTALGMLLFILGLVTERVYQRAETNRIFGSGPGPVAFARGAAEYLNRNQVRGPLFSSFTAGSYFVWAVPREKVFIDGRLEVHTPAHYERYLRIMQGGDAWGSAEREFGFNAVVLQQTDGHAALLGRIMREGGWVPVHLDESAIVLLRRTPANEPIIERDALTASRLRAQFPALTAAQVEAGLRLPDPPSALARLFRRERFPWSQVYLGQFFLSINAKDLALAQLVEAVRAAPAAAMPRLLAAMTLNQMDRPKSALELLDSLRRVRQPAAVAAQVPAARGDALSALGRTDEAIAAYTEYLDHPFSPQQIPSVLASRATAKLRAGDLDGAETDLRESLRLRPEEAQSWWVMGRVAEARGQTKAARQAYLRFRQLGGRSAELEAALARVGEVGG